ncbi:MAG TPA: hypothetical protein VEG62_00010 [Acidimicrobiales bacterium]|nr:hypothetical protein [Acidimicrobiales bacterium]HXZ61090.1 hypothetical protein [Acidimicrobiales bacterium]
MDRIEGHGYATVAKPSTSDAEQIGAPRREVAQVDDHLRTRGPGMAGVHGERAHHVGRGPSAALQMRTAQQRRADVQRPTEQDVGQHVARQPQDDHDRRRRRSTSDPTTPVTGQQCAHDDDRCGDHRRDQEQEHVPHAGHQFDEHVDDGIHRPEGVERERPAIE